MNAEAEKGSGKFKYWAFLSYSHTDRKWGDWLHKALETYRVPRRLVGKESRDGKIPPRLFPIFRDREELPVSADLGSNISEALQESRYLIVICSHLPLPGRATVRRWQLRERLRRIDYHDQRPVLLRRAEEEILKHRKAPTEQPLGALVLFVFGRLRGLRSGIPACFAFPARCCIRSVRLRWQSRDRAS